MGLHPLSSNKPEGSQMDPDENELPEEARGRVIERPDGFYWQDESGKEYGSFLTSLDAVQDMQGMSEGEFGEGESLEEAEAEIGIADWIDPDTGELAEDTTQRLSSE